jgi:hypothetical protein
MQEGKDRKSKQIFRTGDTELCGTLARDQVLRGLSSVCTLHDTHISRGSLNVLLSTFADKLSTDNAGSTIVVGHRIQEFGGVSRYSVASRIGMEGNAEERLFFGFFVAARRGGGHHRPFRAV